jgi:hypothetical protein
MIYLCFIDKNRININQYKWFFSKYNMWDLRRENKELIDKFDIILTHGVGALLID